MKQSLFLAITVLTFLSSCQSDPSISVTPQSATPSMEGGTFEFTVSSDGEWKTSSPADITVSPSSGFGNSLVSITIPKNDLSTCRDIEVTFYCVMSTSSQIVSIKQDFWEDPISMKVTKVPVIVDFLKGTYTIKVESNYPWEATAPEGATVSPKNGTAGTSDIKVTIPEYSDEDATEYREWNFQIKANSIKSELTKTLQIKQIAQNLQYKGETYKLVKLQDGRTWMAENLYLVPTENGPFSKINDYTCNIGVWYPTKVSSNTQQFDTSQSGIVAKGYLYTLETALGVDKGTITKENAANYEGARGICPEGWHLPTVTEMVNLVGKCENSNKTNTKAPYYDTNSKSISKLEKDNWPMNGHVAGLIKNKILTGTTGSPKKLINGCFIGSSCYSGLQFYGMKFDVSAGTISVTYSDINISDGTDGASVRCIMDTKTMDIP